MSQAILGISAFYHDSAAALIIGDEIIAAAQEERFTRKKHDASFPSNSIGFVLDEAGLRLADLDAVSFYDKPYLKFERLLETYHSFAPSGLRSFLSAMPVWIKEKLFMRKILWEELEKIEGGKITRKPDLFFPEHHLSHAASCFFPSPFKEAAILTIDGVGEWDTTTICHGSGTQITKLKELAFPHSLGLLYSSFTYYCGFRVNSGEYKLMGLAPYGNQHGSRVKKIRDLIYTELIDVRDDGSLLLNLDYFNYPTGLKMCHDDKWRQLFGIPKRTPESEFSQEYMDMALAIQQVTEEIVLRLAQTCRKSTESRNLVMAGGVALNCVANGKILQSDIFDNIWIQPAAGDAGGALGAAYAARYIGTDLTRTKEKVGKDRMNGSYLGPEFSELDTKKLIRKFQAPYQYFSDFSELCDEVSGGLANEEVVGWFQGRMEWGPRALGNRSIIGDPRSPNMQKKLNLKIKYREGFRPFAPSVLEEDLEKYFDLITPSPYMQIVAPVKYRHRKSLPEGYEEMGMYERLYHHRSDVPAITHVDYSARIQSVSRSSNERYWQLITSFKERTSCGMLVNTSFNVRGEPIVCTPEDAYQCFMKTEMDILVIGNFLFRKKDQPNWKIDYNPTGKFDLD